MLCETQILDKVFHGWIIYRFFVYLGVSRETILTNAGLAYDGGTPALGAGRPSSILGSPTKTLFHVKH